MNGRAALRNEKGGGGGGRKQAVKRFAKMLIPLCYVTSQFGYSHKNMLKGLIVVTLELIIQ